MERWRGMSNFCPVLYVLKSNFIAETLTNGDWHKSTTNVPQNGQDSEWLTLLCATSNRPTISQISRISAHNEWRCSLRANACSPLWSNTVWTAAFPIHQQRVPFSGHLQVQVRWRWCFQVLFCQIKFSYVPETRKQILHRRWWMISFLVTIYINFR